jgi:hypothetical protein
MKNAVRIQSALIVILLLAGLSVQAQDKVSPNTQNLRQDSTTLYHIETKDGNTFVGHIVEQDNMSIRFRTENLGVITLIRQDILRIEIINDDKFIEGVYWADHFQSTRYFWQPNGYGLKKGEGYYQNVWILFNQFSVGVTDHFLIGGGIMPLFLFAGAPTPVWITPKVSIPIVKDKFNIGAGGLFLTVLGENLNLGIPYATATIGPRDKNVSVGVGYAYSEGQWADSPTITLSALIRTGQKGYILTENYYIGTGSDYLILMMLGGRRIIGQRAGLDFGLVLPLGPFVDQFVAIPWLGVTIPFGKNP